MPTVTPVPGRPNLLIGGYDLVDLGHTASEFFISGTASSYAGEGAAGEAEYTTRIVALTPIDSSTFNGTVLVKWLNVSGGIDTPAVWMMAHREIARSGYAYVVVSAQKVGVDGGQTITGIDMSLKKRDPQRYSTLNHPGDAFAYDIFSRADGQAGSGRIAGRARSTTVLRRWIGSRRHVDPLAPSRKLAVQPALASA